MVEALVIGILERVLGDYVSGRILNRQEVKTRAQVVELVQSELATTTAKHEEQMYAMTVAIRELDTIVRRDPYLEWRDDERLELAVRHGIRRRKVSPEDALKALEQCVAERRNELHLPTTPDEVNDASHESKSQPDSDAPPDEPTVTPGRFEFVPVEPEPAEPRSEGDLSEWERRVLNLSSDVAAERRRRTREGGS